MVRFHQTGRFGAAWQEPLCCTCAFAQASSEAASIYSSFLAVYPSWLFLMMQGSGGGSTRTCSSSSRSCRTTWFSSTLCSSLPDLDWNQVTKYNLDFQVVSVFFPRNLGGNCFQVLGPEAPATPADSPAGEDSHVWLSCQMFLIKG